MLCNLATSYVVAINNGAVPNIETAWTYICKDECAKALEQSLTSFEDLLKEEVLMRLPVDEDDLKDAYNNAKKQALAMFTKKAVGSVADSFVLELKTKMSNLYATIKEENER